AGLGVAAPHGSPGAVVAPACLLAGAGGVALLLHGGRWQFTGRRMPFVSAGAVLAVVSLAVVLLAALGRNQSVVALLASLVAVAVASAALLAVTGARRARGRDTSNGTGTPRRPHPLNNLVGATLGLAACTAGALQTLAEHSPERLVVTDGVTHVAGPLVPLMLHTGLIAAAAGIAVALVVVPLAALRGRRLPHLLAVPSTTRLFTPGVVAVGLLLRVGALLTFNDARRDAGDPFFYHVTANLLAHGRGFIEPVTWVGTGGELASALHGPAFPAALSFWSRLGGTGYLDQQIASIVLGLPQIVGVILLGHLLLGRRAALIGGLLAVAYPNIWVTDGTLFVEGLMAGFTTFATVCAYRYHATRRTRWAVAVGALVGLAALTRGEALLLVPLLLVPLVLRARDIEWRRRLQQTAIGVAAFVAVLAPWMIYNTPRFNVFVPLSTNSNEVLFYANCDDVYSGPAIGFWSFACQVRYREEFGEPPGDQAEKAEFWRSEGIAYAKAHWQRLPKVVIARVGRQWELFRPGQTIDFAMVEDRPTGAVRAGQWMYYGLMLLAAAGTWGLRRRGRPVWPLWVQALAVTLTAAYAYGTLRFRAPFEPILCVLAAAGIVALLDHRLRRPAATAGPPDAATVAAPSTTQEATV
ncbi:MAG: glycosyltransferase family 39 protein, partial [Actinomycetota bacterium]|nr:glycosyltransferase family 39 protein [Actinomycetota bacterium]